MTARWKALAQRIRLCRNSGGWKFRGRVPDV